MGETLGEFLKKLREEKGYSLREAGKQTGIAEAYLWQLENGKRGIAHPEMFKKLAKGYGVPAETLLKHAGYLEKPADQERETAVAKTHLFRDYEKLSPDRKKQLENFLRFLQKEEPKK